MPRKIITLNPYKNKKVPPAPKYDPTAAQKFIKSRTWQKARRLFLQENPFCVVCFEQRQEIVPATDAHHIIDRADSDESQWLDPAGLQALCHSCHSEITCERMRKKQRSC